MQKTSVNLLVVDDEPAMRRVLRASLGVVGFTIEEASTGEAAVGLLQQRPSDLVLMDINMPGIGGVEACRRIRQIAPETGIIVVTVCGREEDKVRALEAGADDYVTKPFRLRELIARLRAVLRRSSGDGPGPKPVLRAGDLELDLESRTLRKAGRIVRLSQKEFDILAYLMRHRDTPIPHARLLQAVWGPEYGGELEYLRTYMRHLRKKIEADAAAPQYLLTEPWLGYRFQDPSAAPVAQLKAEENGTP